MPACQLYFKKDAGKAFALALKFANFESNEIMKKISVCLFLLYSTSSEAQGENKREALLGIRIGASYTNFNFNAGYPPPPRTVTSKAKAGISAGALINVSLTDYLSLQPEFSFLSSSSTRNDSMITYHFSYLSFPVLLKYEIIKRLHLLGGGQFDLLIQAQKKPGTPTNITHDVEERSIGITAGAEYFFQPQMSFTLRYIHGLNHIGIGQRSNVQEYKSRQLLATAGFYF